MLQKMPYSTPTLTPKPLGDLPKYFGKREREAGGERMRENGLPRAEFQPPIIVVEGFDGDVRTFVQRLSELGWPSEIGSEQNGAVMLESCPERSRGRSQDGISIMLLDVRRRGSKSSPSPGQVENKMVSTGILILVLTDSGEAALPDSSTCRNDRWFFRGPITPSGLAVLVRSVFQMRAAGMETLSESSPALEKSGSRVSALAFAERD
jgi:hypothetical protein